MVPGRALLVGGTGDGQAPYGETRTGDLASLPTDFGFTGQRNESTIGLYDYRARFYVPTLGRFISADTIVPEPGNPQAFNRYAYCLNNPLKYRDPSGHWVDTVIDIISIGITVNDIRQNGWNWGNGISLAADAASLALPVVAGGGMMVRAATKIDDAADAVRTVDRATDSLRLLERVREIGRWVQRNESMSDAARAYQRFISGRADDLVFELGGYTFDHFDEAAGILKDAKAIPNHFVDPASGSFKHWVSGTDDWLKQAANQVQAADGVPIEWAFDNQAARDAMYNLLLEQNPGLLESIDLVFRPMPSP